MAKQTHGIEPIRGSPFILGFKIIFLLALFELAYLVIYYFLNVQFEIPYSVHHHLSIGFLILASAKIFLEMYLILLLVLSWANNVYYLADKHIIKRTGVLSSKEKVYDFDLIRSITVQQSFFGKLFNFGTIMLSTSASGGYQAEITLDNISDPQKYEQRIKECCS